MTRLELVDLLAEKIEAGLTLSLSARSIALHVVETLELVDDVTPDP